MLSEINETQKDKCTIISWDICLKNKNKSGTKRIEWWLPEAGGKEETGDVDQRVKTFQL